MRVKSLILTVVAGLFLAPAQVTAQEVVGVVAGMQTQVIRGQQQMRVGQQIFRNDTVRTNETGISQFQFTDRSSAKLGPNSSIQFSSDILELAGREATIAVRMISGIARFTGSDSTKTKPMIVRTPNMALGVLGGVADVSNMRGRVQSNLLSGRMICAAGAVRKFVRNPGYSCIVGPDGILKVVKTPKNFAFALDSTAIPDVGPTTGANIPVSGGRFPGQTAPLHCGSDDAARDPDCRVEFGGYPLPDNRQPFGRLTETSPGETNSGIYSPGDDVCEVDC